MFANKSCVRVAVTGAAGQAGYAMLPLIASGRMLGPKQRLQLNLLDVEPVMSVLEGVRAELVDCAFPLVDRVLATPDPKVAFEQADFAIMFGSVPLKPGMLRKDLLRGNARLIEEQGRVLGEVAHPDCRVCIVTNPANTMAHVLLNASNGKLKPENVTALTRLDQNRATALVAERS
ncbi:putative cytosolic malate dehydrogenase, partial [Trypanosoma conorhini]